MRHSILFSLVTIITVLFLFSFSKNDSKNIVVKDNISGSFYSLEDYNNDNSSSEFFNELTAKVEYLLADASDNLVVIADSKTDNKTTAKKTAPKDNATTNNTNVMDPLTRAIQDNATKVYNGFKNLINNGFEKPSSKDNGTLSDEELLNSLINSISKSAIKIYDEFNQLIAKDNKSSDNKTAVRNKNDNATK